MSKFSDKTAIAQKKHKCQVVKHCRFMVESFQHLKCNQITPKQLLYNLPTITNHKLDNSTFNSLNKAFVKLQEESTTHNYYKTNS